MNMASHNSPSRVKYGVLVVSIWKKINYDMIELDFIMKVCIILQIAM